MKESTLEQRCCTYVSAIGGLNIKNTGLIGFPDRTHIIPGGRILFVEYKNPNKKGKRSPAQILMGLWLQRNNLKYAIIDNYDDFINLVEK